MTQATDYGVWGDVIREQKTEESKYRYGYQGQFAEKDDETGWNHFELRQYDAVVGRWTSTDPAGQYWSPYLGMGNNPVSGSDPDGAYSRFGAWWRNIRDGGTGSYKSEDGVWGYDTKLVGEAGISSHFGDEHVGTFWKSFNISDENEILDRASAEVNWPYDVMVYGDGIEPSYPETWFMPLPKGLSAFSGAAKASRSLFATSRAIQWSSPRLIKAARGLVNGAREVTVKSKEEAEELFMGLYHGRGYKNTTGMSTRDMKDKYMFPKGKNGTYHWDLSDSQHGGRPHLQIHDHSGSVTRIFFE